MVNILELHVGDKVKIVDEWCKGCYQNLDGAMDKWLSKVVTVRYIGRDYIHIEEDSYERNQIGWYWYPEAIDYIISSKYDDVKEIDGIISFLEGIKEEN